LAVEKGEIGQEENLKISINKPARFLTLYFPASSNKNDRPSACPLTSESSYLKNLGPQDGIEKVSLWINW